MHDAKAKNPMTPEEKYQEIVKSREVASGAEDSKVGETKATPTAEKETKTEVKEPPKETQQPEGEKKATETTKKEPTEAEKQEKAFAKMRYENKRLLERIKALEAGNSANKGEEKPKTEAKKRADFANDDEYGNYLYDRITKEVTEKLTAQFEERQKAASEREESNKALKESLVKSFGSERAESVWNDLQDETSMMSQIITDGRGVEMAKAIGSSKRSADLLALMQAKPEIFTEILELSPEKQKYRIFALEDAIDERYKAVAAKQQADAEKQVRKDSVPVTGTFGVNGNGSTDISGLSSAERVARYKKEILESRRR